MAEYIHYGEVWRRIAAGALDMAILAPLVGLFWLLMPAPPEEAVATSAVFSSGLIMFYRMVLEGSGLKATIGKYLLDLKVTNRNGDQLLFATTALRGWPFWLPGAMVGVTGELIVPLMVLSAAALALIPLTERRQGLHDISARTIVVRRYIEPGATTG